MGDTDTGMATTIRAMTLRSDEPRDPPMVHQKGPRIATPDGSPRENKRRFADGRRWIIKGGASIVDQAMLAGANFVANVLLARWLPPAQYGAFTLAYSVFLLFGTFHTSVFSEPMLVFGAGKYAQRFRRYIGLLTLGHIAVMVPICLILIGVSVLLGRVYPVEVQRALEALAFAGPFMLLLWLLKRAFYVSLKPEWAVLGGASYLVLLLGSFFLLRAVNKVSPAMTFLAMGWSGLPATLLLMKRLRPQWRDAGDLRAAEVIDGHWRYSRWAVGSSILTWIPGNIYFTVLPAWAGLEGVASLRALTNLVLPVGNTIGALSLLLVPLLARNRTKGRKRLTRTMAVFLALFLAGAGIYYLGLVFFRGDVVRILYGGRYSEIVPLVPLVGLLAVTAGFTAVFGAALRALERPDEVFWSYVVSSAVAFGAGIILARTLGTAGALWGLLLSSAATTAMMSLFFRRFSARQERL
jgi:O-antigen/teichoic acid export membrane protein